mgnify:CR=1 FL=1
MVAVRSTRRLYWLPLIALTYLGAAGQANAQFLPSPQGPTASAVPGSSPYASQALSYQPLSYPTAQQASFQSIPGVRADQQSVPAAAGAIPGPPPGPTSDLVVDVRVVGNKRVPTEKLMRYIRTRPGRPYSAEAVGEDVRNLNKSGLVVSVRPQYQEAPNGQGRIVVYEVFERATIRSVHYVGNRKIKSRTLAKETKIKAGDPLEPFNIEEARNRLESGLRAIMPGCVRRIDFNWRENPRAFDFELSENGRRIGKQ